MNNLWDKFKGRVDTASSHLPGMSLIKNEKDKNENDTIISRALLRFYKSDVPEWLSPADQRPENASIANNAQNNSSTASTTSHLSRATTSSTRPSLDFMYQQSQPSSTNVPAPARATSLSEGSSRPKLGDKLRRANW